MRKTFNCLYFFLAPALAFAEGKGYCQGEMLSSSCPSAYNAPAAPAVTHKLKKGLVETNIFLEAAFTYWYVGQEGMKVASNAVLNSATLSYAQNITSYIPSFNYQPGFKLGLGIINSNEWQYKIGYTFVNSSISTKFTPPSGESLPAGSTTTAAGTPVLALDDWFLQGGTNQQALAASNISSKWKLDFNFLDFTIGRPYYQGRALIASPFGGLEVGFIDQNFSVEARQASGQTTNATIPIWSRNSSSSWGVGPVLGLDTRYLWGQLSLITKGAFGLLYTNYTSIKHNEDAASSSFNAGPYYATIHNLYAMRPNATLCLGIEWDRYLNCDANHLNIALTYDFAIYFAQNMMREQLNEILTGAASAPSNLFFQGLTVSARVDF